MADRLIVATGQLNRAAAELDALRDILTDVGDLLAGVDTSKQCGGELEIASKGPNSGKTAAAATRELLSATRKNVELTVDLANATRKSAETFEEAEREISHFIIGEGASPNVYANGQGANIGALGSILYTNAGNELAEFFKDVSDAVKRPFEKWMADYTKAREKIQAERERFEAMRSIADRTSEVDPSVFDPSKIKHVYYIYGYNGTKERENIGHTALLLVDENGNGFHYCYYNTGQLGLVFINKEQVDEFYTTGYLPAQVSTDKRTVGPYYNSKGCRYYEAFDVNQNHELNKKVYERCLDHFKEACDSDGQIDYSLITNNCDDMAFLAIEGKKSKHIIPKRTFDDIRKAYREAGEGLDEARYKKLGNETPKALQ